MCAMQTVMGGGGSRWCPTPEQVMLLEGMYRGGLKTPTATQIQQITARLSVYGKIQGKNVFYWFQNHKARDRQKLRKKLMAMYQQQQQQRTLQYPRPYNNYNSPAAAAYHNPNIPQLIQGGAAGLVDQEKSFNSCSSSKNNMVIKEWRVAAAADDDDDEKKVNMCDCSLMTTTVMMMRMKESTSSPFCRVPPKTLQLFPTTTTTGTTLSDDRSSVHQHQHL